jgi:type II secretion system protein N
MSNRTRITTFMAYSSWFSFCFAIAVVVTFPLDGLRPLLVTQLEKALGKGRPGVRADPVVTIGDLSMSGFGVKAKRVSLQLSNTDPEPGPVVDIDSLWVSASFASLVSSNKTLQFDASLYEGDIAGSVTVNDKQDPVAVDIDIDDVNLGKIAPLMAKLHVPVEGKATGTIDIDLGVQADKDAKGSISLDVTGFGLGAGKLAIPGVPGDFSLENGLPMGNLKLRAPIDKGTGPVELTLEGAGDVEANVTGTLNMKQKLAMSRLDIDGWLKPLPSLLTKNPLLKSAIDLADQFGGNKAKDDEGRYHFSARGPLQTLKPALSRDAGRKAATKAAKAAKEPKPSSGAPVPAPLDGADEPPPPPPPPAPEEEKP